MGGSGERFIDSGYKKYKPFLPVEENKTILDKILYNFKQIKTEIIIIGNKKKIKKNCSKHFLKKIHLIEIIKKNYLQLDVIILVIFL